MKPKQYIRALILTLIVVLALSCAQNATRRVQTLSDTIIDLKGNFDACVMAAAETEQEHLEQIESLQQRIDEILRQQNNLQDELKRKADKTDRGGERGTRRMMTVTAYDLSVESCGKLPNHPEYGITASGERVREWHTVAAGKELPFGTNIYIPYFADKPNGGVFTVQDRGSAIKRDCIDVYIADNAACWEFGRRELEVWVIE